VLYQLSYLARSGHSVAGAALRRFLSMPPDLAAAFRALHARERLFLMPNPWDVGSAKLLRSLGFEALATTSAGLAWSLGKLDMQVTRGELVAHVRALAAATPLPLNVDSERCFPDDPGGVAETARVLAEAGAAGFSIEDFDPRSGRIEDLETATARVTETAQAKGDLVLTARAENHLHGIDDLDDTIARLAAYRDAGADVVYAPGLRDLAQIEAVVAAVAIPVNVLALPGGPSVAELAAAGVRRVSTGGALARAGYGALLRAATELRDSGTSAYAKEGAPMDAFAEAFRPR
jgi:2-methylisocitrate lyase-like PEP mutase family enzyme